MPFCASCLADAPDLASVMLDERRVLMCGACLDEHPRSGRYSFDSGAEPDRGRHGVGVGNVWLGAGPFRSTGK